MVEGLFFLGSKFRTPGTTVNKPVARSTSISSLIIPIAWGGAVYLLIAALLDGRVIENELAVRYLTGHPISRVTSFLFCIGMIALFGHWFNVLRQSRQLARIELSPLEDSEGDQGSTDDRSVAETLIADLENDPPTFRSNEGWKRVYSLLHFIGRSGSTEHLEQELKYESESALERQHQQLSFVKILIWATPMLGFLGTVIGISQALGQLDVGPDNNLQAMMGNLQSNLYVAFDTTALALMLSMVMMFAMFFVERVEQSFLQQVEEHTLNQISQCFAFSAPTANNAETHVRRVGQKLLAATRVAVREQTELWQQSLATAEQAWSRNHADLASETREQLSSVLSDWSRHQTDLASETRTQVSTALSEVLNRFVVDAKTVAKEAEESLGERLGQWQTLLSETTRAIESQQQLNQTQCELLGTLLSELQRHGEAQQQESQAQRDWQAQEVARQLAADQRDQQRLDQWQSSLQDQLIHSRELEQIACQRWDELNAEQMRQQEVQHHRFQQELGLFRETIERLDVAQKIFVSTQAQSFETNHAEEHRAIKDNLIEMVELMQLMKDELVQIQQARLQQSQQQFRLQVAEGTRKSA